jgi:type VI protein secretion system component Hcp
MIFQPKTRRFMRPWLMLLGLAMTLVVGEVRAGGWYLKIDGLPAAKDEPGPPGWTVVLDVNSNVSLPINPTNPTPGPPIFACEIRKRIDSLSPLLMSACATGQVFSRLNLASVPANGVQYRITLDSVRIGSVVQRSSTNTLTPALQETVQIYFETGKVEMARLELNEQGGATGGLTAVFDPATGEGKLKPRVPFRANITHARGQGGMLVQWPAETGHRYRILSRATFNDPWKELITYTGLEDGPANYFIATPTPNLFLCVEEVD